ncbi:uroporphyrinogen-III C-methyltransferase [Salipaludibacillus sp. HK11]|uniref:uroporphyrinogen-III C-methyltransferase n=1 Tax=Salipaludibacillus sp. HK11 TaxID=3394320 RepID=UPI0039FD23FE
MLGYVSFVGAGPGDLGLVTEKGIRCLREADVVLYDRLANPRLLRVIKADCQLIYCGKLPDRHMMRQDKINETIIEKARIGKKVVRLKGGDPAVFGRVGEEAGACQMEGIGYDIVPGITSSIAAASYAGIPVTHRDHSASITLRTGHSSEETNEENITRYEHGDTIAYYMGVKNLDHHCQVLMRQGFSPETKVAVIEWATTGKQRTAEGTLPTISNEVIKQQIKNPAMTIIGDVVGLRDQLKWFEKKSMFGKRILIAKSSAEESGLERYFLDQGAEAYAFPTLKIAKKPISIDWLARIRAADNLLFRAPESVAILFEAFCSEGYDLRDLPREIYCLSEKTKRVLLNKGILSEKITRITEDMIQVGYETKQESIEDETNLLLTHSLKYDARFTEIDQRMLHEETWETVIFPSKSSVDWFVKTLENYGIEQLSQLSFAYIGERVKEYAEKKGFQIVNEEVQQELGLGKWKNTQR